MQGQYPYSTCKCQELLFRSKVISQWCLRETATSLNNEWLDRHQPFLSCITRWCCIQETLQSVNCSHDVAGHVQATATRVTHQQPVTLAFHQPGVAAAPPPSRSLTKDLEISGPTSPAEAATVLVMWCSSRQQASHVPRRQSESLAQC